MTEKKQNKREKYHEKMTKLGFGKIQPYVHFDDKEQVLSLVKELREKRLNSACNKSESDL